MDDEPSNLEQLRRLTKQLSNGQEHQKQQLESELMALRKEINYQNRMAQIFVTEPGDEMYGEVLDVVLEAMDSPYGAFGYLDEDDNWICPSITKDIWDQCQIEDKTFIFPKTLWDSKTWGKVYATMTTIVVNKPVAVPEGHISVTRLLIAPLIQRHNLTGMIAVANKETPYTDADKGILERLARYITPILSLRLELSGRSTTTS